MQTYPKANIRAWRYADKKYTDLLPRTDTSDVAL